MENGESIPAGVVELLRVMDAYFLDEHRLKGIQFKPSATDVIVSTASKSGTTWVQQICHGLRSGGDMNFDEICMVIPCLEMAGNYGYGDLQAPQPYQPRMYKTHFWYPSCPKGAGKYIIVARDPSDAALSFYKFLKDWLFVEGQITLEEFIDWIYLRRGVPKSDMENSSQMHHIVSWYPYRLDENVLWLHFEDLKQNLRECVRLIAEFLDIGSKDEKLQELVTHQATYEFMKKHQKQFDEHPIKLARNEAAGLPRNAGLNGNSGKVRSGESGVAKNVLPKHLLDKIQQKWKDVITAETGYETYETFRNGINDELKRNFEH